MQKAKRKANQHEYCTLICKKVYLLNKHVKINLVMCYLPNELHFTIQYRVYRLRVDGKSGKVFNLPWFVHVK